MSILKKIFLAATALLAYSLNIFSQNTPPTPEPEGVYVYTSVEDFNYETLSGKLKIESFVKDDIPNPIPPTPLDLVFVIDVSGSMGSNSVYAPQSEKGYSYKSINVGGPYYYLYDGVYCEVNRRTKDSNYQLYFYPNNDDDNSRHYLSGTKDTTTAPSNKSDSNVIFTGVLYTKEGTRLEVVKEAAQDFVDVIKLSSSQEVNNKIALVTFSNDGTEKLGFTSVDANASTIKTTIGGLTAGGGTYTNKGVAKALSVFNGAYPSGTYASDREQVLIVFTDGKMSGTDTDYNAAISSCKTMKDKGVTVFTVGLLDNKNLTDKMNKLMNYMSSNYPVAESLTKSGTQESDIYFTNSPDGSEIVSTFNQIAEMVAPTKLILGTDTEVKNAFKASVKLDLPGGSTANIKAYTADCTGYDSSTKTYSFGTPAPLTGLTITPVTDPSTGAQSLETNGFDYSDKWCGVDGSGNIHGQELILEIPFYYTPTPGNLNDKELDLNDKEAGMYKDGSKVASAKFMSSAVPFAELTISKAGLHNGESAIFEIVRGKLGTETADAPVNRIVLTGTADDGTTVSYTLHYLNPAATYIVSEHADWSWTYKPKETVTGGLVTKSQAIPDAPVGTNGGKSATLTFENTKYTSDKLQKNAEAIK